MRQIKRIEMRVSEEEFMLIRYQAKTSAQYLGRTKSPTISSYLRFLINRDARVIKDELYQKNKTVEDVTKKIQ